MLKKILILGGEGNGEVIASVIDRSAGLELAGFVNDFVDIGSSIGKYRKIPVVLRTDDLPELIARDPSIFIISAYGGISDPKCSHDRLNKLSAAIPQERWCNIFDQTAVIPHDWCRFGFDIFVAPLAQFSPNVTVSDHCSFFGNAFVGHDSTIGEFCRVTSNAVVLSNVNVGRGTHVGSNSVIRERITVGEYSIIGAGAVVVKDVPAYGVVAGNPAGIIKMRDIRPPHVP